ALTLKVTSASLIHLIREPRGADQREPFGCEHSQCCNRCQARDNHGDTSRSTLQTGLERRIVGGTSHIAAASEGVHNRVQRGRAQQFGGIVHKWWLGKGTHWIIGNGPIHRSARLVGPEGNARGVDGNSIWS